MGKGGGDRGSSPCAAGADQQMGVARVCRSHFDPSQKPLEPLFISICHKNGLKAPDHAACTTELRRGTLSISKGMVDHEESISPARRSRPQREELCDQQVPG